jgi:hypothetical protein
MFLVFFVSLSSPPPITVLRHFVKLQPAHPPEYELSSVMTTGMSAPPMEAVR